MFIFNFFQGCFYFIVGQSFFGFDQKRTPASYG